MKEIFNNPEITNSIKIIEKHKGIVCLMSFSGVGYFTIYLESHAAAIYINNIVFIVSLLLAPIVYGIFVELIKDYEYELLDVCKKYIINYFLAILVIYSPLIIFILIRGIVIKNNVILITLSIRLLITCMSIYMLPIIFLTGQLFSSVAAGLFFLIKYFRVNLDLIAISIIRFILSMLAKGYIFKLFNAMNLVISLFAFGLFFVSEVLQLIIFTTAILRLKAKALEQR